MTAVYTAKQPKKAAIQETTAVSAPEPVSTAEAAVSGAEVTSTDNTTQAAEPPQTTTSAATAAVTIPVTTAQQTAPPIAVTEPITEDPYQPTTEYVPPTEENVYADPNANYGY